MIMYWDFLYVMYSALQFGTASYVKHNCLSLPTTTDLDTPNLTMSS